MRAAKPARKSTKKAARKSVKKTTTRGTTRSKQHLQAMAEGRAMSATVERYMRTIATPKRRGRKVSVATLTSRLATAQTTLRSSTGVARLLTAQEIRDLKTKLTVARASSNGHGVESAEREFIKIAKAFGERRGITYGAWRDAGVPAATLRKAGIPRTRDNTNGGVRELVKVL